VWETLELRTLFDGAAFDVTGITALRNDPNFAGIDGSGLAVAVLDTGMFASHPDLSGNFLRFFDAVKNGQNAATDPGSTNPSVAYDPPGEGHGTHVSGIVGSTNANIGVANATDLIGVRVLTTDSDPTPRVDPVTAGLQWVLVHQATYNIRVVNMSLGNGTNFNFTPQRDTIGNLIAQLQARGVTVVSAAGNDYGGYATQGESYPSIFSTISAGNTWEDSGTAAERADVFLGQGSDGIFGVTDTNPNVDQFSATSQRAASLPNFVAAPGTTIFSTWNGDGGLFYNTIAGTSMASPLIAGAVALMQDAAMTYGGRYLQPSEVLSIIRSTADNIVDTQDPGTARFPLGVDNNGNLVQVGPQEDLPETGQTYKRINVYKAVQQVRVTVTGTPTPTPTPPPPTPTPTPTGAPDTNQTLATATPIPSLNGLDQFDFQGNIGNDGTTSILSKDVDLYKIVLDSPGFPVFDLNPISGGITFDPFVRLFNSSGVEIASQDDSGGDTYPTLNTSTHVFQPLPAGTYYLGVSSNPNTTYNPTDGSGIQNGVTQGDYNVSIRLSNPDPNGVVQGASPVDLTNPDSVDPSLGAPANFNVGTIGSDPNPLTADGTPRINTGAEDVDFFSIIAPDTGKFTVNIDAQNTVNDPVDSFVAIYDENLNQLGFNDDQVPGANFDSFITADVTQGAKYFIAITTFQNRLFSVTDPFNRHSTDPNAIGDYAVYFSFTNGDANGTVDTALDFNTLDPDNNGSVDGTIGADNGTALLSVPTNGGAKDVDFFTFTPTQPGLLQVDVAGAAGFNGLIGLWQLDQDGNIVPIADTNNGPASIGLQITSDLVNQKLFVSVTGAGNRGFNPYESGTGNGGQTGNYTLTIKQQSQAVFNSSTNESISNNTPELVNIGEPVRREIGKDGTIDVGADDIDIYRFDSPYNGTLTVRTDTSAEDSADTFLRIFDGNGNQLAVNNNSSSSTTASESSIQVTAGTTYYIGINGASANAGDYNALTGADAAPGSTGHYTMTLTASNADLPFVSVANANAAEVLAQDSTASFAVTLTQPSNVPVTVNYATEDGTATVGADYRAATGTLTFAPGETSKTVDVTVYGDFDDEAAETFNLKLSAASGIIIADNTGVATIANAAVSLPAIEFGGKAPAVFNDANGGKVSISLKGPGTGKVFFTGANTDPGRIQLDGTTAASTLTIKGDSSVVDVIVNGSLKSVGSRTMDLTGHLTVSGSAGIVTFRNIDGATLDIASGTVSFTAASVNDLILTSAAAIKALKVGQWLDTDGTPDVISTPSIGTASIKGAFQADISTGTIGKMTVGGEVANADVHADNSIAGLTVGSIKDSVVFAGASGTTLPDSPDDFVNNAGAILAFAVRSRAAGAFSNTRVAAANMGRVALNSVATSNGGSTFGVAALRIKSISGLNDTGSPLKSSNLDDPAGSKAVGDFVLRLL
jgi:hypothetical protein